MIFNTIVFIIAAFVCGSLIKLVLLYIKSYRILLKSKCFRGPKALPLIGNAHYFIGDTADIYKKMDQFTNFYPSPFRVWLGPKLLFALYDPEHIKLVLTNPEASEKDSLYDVLKPWAGEGLLTASGNILESMTVRDLASNWKSHRKLIEPIFSTKVLESFIKTFQKKSDLLIEKLEMTQEEDIDVFDYMSRYSLEAICGTTMGIRIDALNVENCTYLEMVHRLLEITYLRVVKVWLHPDFIFNNTTMGKMYEKVLKHINSFTDTVIKEIKLQLQDADAGIDSEKEKNLAKLIIKSAENGATYTDKTIRDEISTMIVAGYETTANLLTYAAFVLANYPEVQDKVYEELYTIFGDAGPSTSPITMQQLTSMQYLERVLKEILRLFPATTLLARRLSAAMDVGDYTLPAGSSVLIGLFKVHRSEDYWPEALVFNPDRFLPGHPMAARHPHAFIPFSIGPRNCIGRRYGIMSAKTVLANLLWRYVIKTRKMQTVRDLEIKVDVTLKPKNPIKVYLTRRSSVHSKSL